MNTSSPQRPEIDLRLPAERDLSSVARSTIRHRLLSATAPQSDPPAWKRGFLVPVASTVALGVVVGAVVISSQDTNSRAIAPGTNASIADPSPASTNAVQIPDPGDLTSVLAGCQTVIDQTDQRAGARRGVALRAVAEVVPYGDRSRGVRVVAARVGDSVPTVLCQSGPSGTRGGYSYGVPLPPRADVLVSIFDADIVQEKPYDWFFVGYFRAPIARIDVSFIGSEKPPVRAELTKNGIWSAHGSGWSEKNLTQLFLGYDAQGKLIFDSRTNLASSYNPSTGTELPTPTTEVTPSTEVTGTPEPTQSSASSPTNRP
jgi:hypothetical protein